MERARGQFEIMAENGRGKERGRGPDVPMLAALFTVLDMTSMYADYSKTASCQMPTWGEKVLVLTGSVGQGLGGRFNGGKIWGFSCWPAGRSMQRAPVCSKT